MNDQSFLSLEVLFKYQITDSFGRCCKFFRETSATKIKDLTGVFIYIFKRHDAKHSQSSRNSSTATFLPHRVISHAHFLFTPAPTEPKRKIPKDEKNENAPRLPESSEFSVSLAVGRAAKSLLVHFPRWDRLGHPMTHTRNIVNILPSRTRPRYRFSSLGAAAPPPPGNPKSDEFFFLLLTTI